MVGQTTCSLHEILLSVIISHVNISWREQIVWSTKGTGVLQNQKFLIFDGKQYLVPWILKSPLTSVLIEIDRYDLIDYNIISKMQNAEFRQKKWRLGYYLCQSLL